MGEAIADCEQEKRIVHYSSNQNILLVGEGNFSFATCLAKVFGSAVNMVATSLDSRGNNNMVEIFSQFYYMQHKFYFCFWMLWTDANCRVSIGQVFKCSTQKLDRIGGHGMCYTA